MPVGDHAVVKKAKPLEVHSVEQFLRGQIQKKHFIENTKQIIFTFFYS
jgi:hypothetical protein